MKKNMKEPNIRISQKKLKKVTMPFTHIDRLPEGYTIGDLTGERKKLELSPESYDCSWKDLPIDQIIEFISKYGSFITNLSTASSLSEKSKAWLMDVLIWGGLIPETKTLRKPQYPDEKYQLMYGYNGAEAAKGSAAAKAICTAMITRGFDEQKHLDVEFDTLAKFPFNPDGKSCDSSRQVYGSPSMFASMVASFCLETQLDWDDTVHSTEEINEFKKTYLGSAVYDTGCLLSIRNAKEYTVDVESFGEAFQKYDK